MNSGIRYANTKSVIESEAPYTWFGLFMWEKHPLCIAVSKNDSDGVRTLLEKGENPNIGRNRPLSLACQLGHENVVSVLLESWEIEPFSPHGEPMLIALREGHLRVCLQLLETGPIDVDWLIFDYREAIRIGKKKFPFRAEPYERIESWIKKHELNHYFWGD